MSDAPKPDRWNSLLETLGVPASELPPPSPPPAQPSASRPPAPPPGQRSKPAAKSRPATRPASSWSAIAGSLGLEVPPEPVSPPPRPASPPPAPRRPAPEPIESRPARGEFAEPELELDDFGPPETQARSASPPAGDFEEDAADEGPILDYDVDSELDLRLEEDTDEPGRLVRDEERSRGERPQGDRSRRDQERAPRGEGAGRESAAREGEREGEREGGRRRRRRGRGRGGRRDEARPEAAPRSSEYLPPRDRGEGLPAPVDEMDDVFAELPELDEDEAEAPRIAARPPEGRAAGDEREGGGRRRRRRGRGGRRGERRDESRDLERGDRREARPPPAREAIDLDAGEEEKGYADELRELLPPAAPSRAFTSAEQLEADLDEDGLEDREGDYPVHKKIPTWEDAVGILIEANMAARSSSPDRSRGRRGRGGR